MATLLEALTPLVGQKSGQNILSRAEELVAGLSSDARDDPRFLIGLAGLRRVCGRLYLRLGNEGKALEQAEAARKIVRAELARTSGNEAAQAKTDLDALKKILHESHLLVGDVMLGERIPQLAIRKSAEDYQRAMAVYEEAAELAHAEISARPTDEKWRQLYFASLMNLADTAWLCKHTDDAQRRFSAAVSELAALRGKQPAAPDLGWIEASFHDRLGTLHLEQDQFEKARQEFDRGLQLREAGASNGTLEDPERQSDMAQSFNKLGNLALNQADWKTALLYYQRSLAIRRKLCEQNPRLDWARNLGYSLSNVAQALWNDHQPQAALPYFAERLKLAEELLAQDSKDANLRSDCGEALFGYADILLNGGNAVQDWSKALETVRNAVTLTERRDPRFLALLAQALRLNNAPTEALAAAEEASKLLPPLEKRTKVDNRTAKEVAYELDKSRTAAAAHPKGGGQQPKRKATPGRR
ncbi:MAG: tetratricopeptide repeat protein [Chthoniobacteraceae bacterium]